MTSCCIGSRTGPSSSSRRKWLKSTTTRRDSSAAGFTGMGFYFVGLDWLRKKVKYWGRAFSLGSEMAESKARRSSSLYLSPVKKKAA